MEDGKWKMENGRWKMEGGRLKMEDGRQKMEYGRWKMELQLKYRVSLGHAMQLQQPPYALCSCLCFVLFCCFGSALSHVEFALSNVEANVTSISYIAI